MRGGTGGNERPGGAEIKGTEKGKGLFRGTEGGACFFRWGGVRLLVGPDGYVSAQNPFELLYCVFCQVLFDEAFMGIYVEYNGVKYSVTRIDTFEGYKQDITLYCKRK